MILTLFTAEAAVQPSSYHKHNPVVCKPWRILCEVDAKLGAMLIQQWLTQLGCWQDLHATPLLCKKLKHAVVTRL